MRFLSKQWLWIVFGLGLLLILYAVLRLTNLTGLPIFTDEAIYIRWSQIGYRDAAWRFISLTDGKQPMFTWIMMGLFKLFEGADPLFVGRLTSVVAGAGTLIGLWVLSYELFRDKRIAWLSSFIYVVLPFSMWYDRMALYDSLAATFFVWGLYVGVLLARYVRLDLALILAMVLSAGMLNKSSGFLTLYFIPVTLLVFDWQAKHWVKRLGRWILFVLIAAVLSQLFYSVLRLSPFFHLIGQKDNVFVFTFSEWLSQPFRFFAGNLRGMFDWLRVYMTLPMFILAFVPLFARWPKFRESLLLYFFWGLPFVALANFGKILYPRYILFMAMPLIIIAAHAFVRLWERNHTLFRRLVLAGLVFIPSVYISGVIMMNPKEALIPLADRGQFIDDWPAGGGVKEVVSYLNAAAKQQKIHVFTEGTFGLMPYALEIYLIDNPDIKITGIWPLPVAMPDQIVQSASVSATYFVLNETQIAPEKWPITLIGEYEKGKRADRKKLRFFRVGQSSSTLP